MTPRQFTAGHAVRALNPDVPELGGSGPAQAPKPFVRAGEAVEREDELRESVRKEIVRRGWAVFCGTTARATGRTLGEPDLIVCADGGRVFFVELKRRAGKVSAVQAAVHHQLRALGHVVHVIRSIEEFHEAVK